MDKSIEFKIALSLIPNIGDILAKRLVAYCGGPEAVFKEKKSVLEKIPGIGTVNVKSIINQQVFERTKQELIFIEKNDITPIFYLDAAYPKRLTYCADSPILLYSKGNANLNAEKMISIVGTREATDYGKRICEKLISELAAFNVTIVSGLAYGIDICAHKAAMENNLPTICVLAHGLDKIYPAVHNAAAHKMLANGGWLTDFTSNTKPDRENFPRRNRIVAGITDATIVIESKSGGGSLITADIANSYNRDVFAFPGRIDDLCSEGCNALIKNNKAALIQSASDLTFALGWQQQNNKKAQQQKKLFIELTPDQEVLINIIREKETITIDNLSLLAKLPMSKVSAILLTLEFAGAVKSLPGKIYRLS